MTWRDLKGTARLEAGQTNAGGIVADAGLTHTIHPAARWGHSLTPSLKRRREGVRLGQCVGAGRW